MILCLNPRTPINSSSRGKIFKPPTQPKITYVGFEKIFYEQDPPPHHPQSPTQIQCQLLMEDNLSGKTAIHGRQPFMENNL